MRNQELEKMLRQLPAPSASQKLKQQCLATIPASVGNNAASAPSTRLKQRELKFAVVALAFTVLAIAFWSTQNSEKPDATHQHGSAAFAQTVEAIQRIKVYHVKGRGKGWSESTGAAQLTDWQYFEAWIDAKRGTYSETRGHAMSTRRSLSTPDGTNYLCTDTSYRAARKEPPHESYLRSRYSLHIYPSLESQKSSEMVDLLMRLSRPGKGSIAGFSSTGEGRWRGVPVTVFEREKPASKDSQSGEPPFITRDAVYINPTTHLPVAMREWSKLPGSQEWELTSEMEFDYQQIDPGRFDPRPLVRGADEIRRAVGNRWVIVKPSQPLRYLKPRNGQSSQNKP